MRAAHGAISTVATLATAAALSFSAFSAGAVKLDETVTGTVVHVLNRTGLPTTAAVGDSFLAHIYLDTDIAPAMGGGGTFTRVWNDTTLGQSGPGPQWIEFTMSIGGIGFYDSRTSSYVDGDNRVQKTLDDPNSAIDGHPALTDGYVVSSDKVDSSGTQGIIGLEGVTHSLDPGHMFTTFDLGETFSFPSDLVLGDFNFTLGAIGRNLNVTATVSSFAALALTTPTSPAPEPSTTILMLAGVGCLIASSARRTSSRLENFHVPQLRDRRVGSVKQA